MARNETTAQPGGGHIYTLRKGGVVRVTSTLPGCGYTAAELAQLREAGYELYMDGQKVKAGRK